MRRIQYKSTGDRSAFALSPDGQSLAAVVWRGDLEANLNTYSILLVDLTGASTPREIFTLSFAGDPHDQFASGISNLMFLGDGRHVAFLGRQEASPAQVFLIDLRTGRTRRVTNHRTAVRSFAMSSDGRLLAFGAIEAENQAARRVEMDRDGVSMMDRSLFPFARPIHSALGAVQQDRFFDARAYFLAGQRQPLYSSRQSKRTDAPDRAEESLEYEWHLQGWSELSASPNARWALLFPFGQTSHSIQPEKYAFYRTENSYSRSVAAPYGLIDVRNGTIRRLMDAPHPQFGEASGAAIWKPDSAAAIIYSLDPTRPEAAPEWVEVDLISGNAVSINAPAGWRAIKFLRDSRGLLVQRRNSFGTVHRRNDGSWGDFRQLGTVSGLSPSWPVSSDGTHVFGVAEGHTSPPEIVSYDLERQTTRVLTQLNPQLSRLCLGEVSEFTWPTSYGEPGSGFLVRPVGYQASERYPLVILLDDGTLRRSTQPYILDAVRQLNAYAIQVLAAEGFAVLYLREPPLADRREREREIVVKTVDGAIAELTRIGLVDPDRVGIAGWSRAAYHASVAIFDSANRFAAASILDGGGREYLEGFRPFRDDELARVHTPILWESYSIRSLIVAGETVNRLAASNRPVELMYYSTGSHELTRPSHRLRSLSTNVDWWRFWLKGEEDPRDANAGFYARWREMRMRQCERLTGEQSPWYCEASSRAE